MTNSNLMATVKISRRLPAANTKKYALFGALFGLLFPIVATALRFVESNLPFNLGTILAAHAADPLLWIIDSAPIFLGLFAAIAGSRQDRLSHLNEILNHQKAELKESYETLEERIKERTAAFEDRAIQLQIVASIAHAIVAIRDQDTLPTEIAKLIGAQFNYYHIGIYLLDEARESLVLHATNSDGGRKMLMRQHHLPLDTTSPGGYAAYAGEVRIVRDLDADSIYTKNPDLPAARSEMALPIRIGGQVIGVLDIQSDRRNAFREDDSNLFAILADQIAVALENARLFREAREALTETQLTFEKYVREEWRTFSRQTRHPGYVFDGKNVAPLTKATKREPATLAQTGSLILDKVSADIAVPLKLRGQTIGYLDVHPKRGPRTWTQDELALVEAAAERAALALENARLIESAQRRLARERAIGEITTRVGTTSNRDQILQIAVEELGRRIGNAEIVIELDAGIT